MPLHDAYLRRTPYERFLPDADFPARRFPTIAGEAAERGIALDDPGAFAMLEAAAEALEELRSADDDADTLRRHALMLFHAFHHHAAGTPVYLLDTAVVRMLVESDAWGEERAPDGDGVEPSVYLQFPQHLLWARAAGDEPPSSLDGAFRTVTGDGRIHVMAVGGLLGDRPGFTVLPAPGVPAAHEPAWRTEAMREGGRDFVSEMPGAELERLYEIRTVGEALKLVARAVRTVERFPGGVEPMDPPGGPASPGGPTPSALSGRRVVLETA